MIPSFPLLALLLVVGCAQTSGTDPTVTLPGLRTIDISPPSTLPAPTNTSSTMGYVVTVVDGATFDLQRTGESNLRFVIPHIQVPLIGTCEGDVSRGALASIIHGKMVRIDPQGLVWLGDVDVGMAMVSYGMAVHVGEWYQAADANSPDIDCANTTTLPPPPVIIVTPQTRPRPVRTTVEDTVVETTPVTEPAPEPSPEETAPPPARPEPPRETEPERPKETDPPQDTQDTVDRTPRTPKPPKTPDVPDTAG
jgi:endonuclease YncB( thermonuclease family)